MEIREFAERVLFGTSLADKLLAPGEPSDLGAGPALLGPVTPARPAALALSLDESARQRFPTRRDLERKQGRGVALHFFANHELLALEAMGLALLRFPDAPPAFRRELVVTMTEEQKHFRLYCERMRKCGVELGAMPVNAFFWTATHSAPTVLDFIVRLSLCFEQANLDYARFYARAFADVGDQATAEVLELVYREEIAHVRRGLGWFRRLIDPGRDEYEAFAERLKLPLSPMRARGIEFSSDARARAGFSEAFIMRLATAGGSKGRSQTAHFFTPDSELCLGARPGYNPPAQFETLRKDLQTVPMFLAARDDVVVVDEAPRLAWLDEMRRAGVPLPEFVIWQHGPPSIDQPRLADLYAWGWAPQTQRRLRPWFSKLPRERARQFSEEWTSQRAELYSKATSTTLLREFLREHGEPWLCDESHVGSVVSTDDAVAERIASLCANGSNNNVIKAVFGVSGRNMRRVTGAVMTEDAIAWLRNVLARQGRVVIEPWLDRVYDLSLRMRIVEPGRASVQGIGQFLTDARGQYKGAILGPATASFDAQARRFANDDGRHPKRLAKAMNRIAQHVAEGLRPFGYTGLVGVDALVFRDGDRLRLKPIVEINARPNMGHVAHALTQLMHHSRVGWWCIVPKNDLIRAGFEDPGEWANHLRERAPLTFIGEGRSRRIASGVLLTTDPRRAMSFASVAVFGRSLAECANVLAPLPSPSWTPCPI